MKTFRVDFMAERNMITDHVMAEKMSLTDTGWAKFYNEPNGEREFVASYFRPVRVVELRGEEDDN